MALERARQLLAGLIGRALIQSLASAVSAAAAQERRAQNPVCTKVAFPASPMSGHSASARLTAAPAPTPGPTQQAAGATGLQALCVGTGGDGGARGGGPQCLCYIPATYRPGVPTPLILTLHGAGADAKGVPRLMRTRDHARQPSRRALPPPLRCHLPPCLQTGCTTWWGMLTPMAPYWCPPPAGAAPGTCCGEASAQVGRALECLRAGGAGFAPQRGQWPRCQMQAAVPGWWPAAGCRCGADRWGAAHGL